MEKKKLFSLFDKEWAIVLRECGGDKIDASRYLDEIVSDIANDHDLNRDDVETALNEWHQKNL